MSAAAGVKGWDEGWGWGGGASSRAGVKLINCLPAGSDMGTSTGRVQGAHRGKSSASSGQR